MASAQSTTWQTLSRRSGHTEFPRGLDASWDKAIGLGVRLVKRPNRFLRRAERIVDTEKDCRRLSERTLGERIAGLHERFRLGRDTVQDLPMAFALLREAADRRLGLRPYPVQVAGALALETGCIIEMATGEGKTLVAAMSAIAAGWRGRGCHVLTANEYLARRDAALMAPLYGFCGLRVAAVHQDMKPPDRRHAYNASVTYCTNKEVAADFLRDQLMMGRRCGVPSSILSKIVEGSDPRSGRLVQRGLACAVVDEADAVLIDEAVTPLIISGQGPNPEFIDAYRQASQLARELDPSEDYRIDKRNREVHLTEKGKRRLAERAEPLGGSWAGARRREERALQALIAREFFIRDKQYVIEGGKILIVDEFTGRLMPDRNWRDGLHQAVEAKEGLDISLPKTTFARISFQRFFRLYPRLSGMTGTGAEARGEFWQIYHRPLVEIPTHRPCRRVVLPDRIFRTAGAKWEAVVHEVQRVRRTGRPILIGTRSVWASEHLSRLLTSKGLDHQVLNAVRHAEEAEIIAGAGQKTCITVATNMAGRGTDIRLGKDVTGLGGLHVIGTERHESGRIDRQLYGRCARQGDPGSAQTFVSLEDELVQRHARLSPTVWLGRHDSTGREVSSSVYRRLIDSVQRRAERAARLQRKEVLLTDNWLDEYLGFAGKAF